MAKLFTKEELEELRRADAELDEEFRLTQEDLERSRFLDREAKLDRLDNRGRRIAAQKAAYREANKEKIADYQAAYREANKQKLLDYQRRYRQKKREAKKKAASGAGTSESGKGNKSTTILPFRKDHVNGIRKNQHFGA